MGTDFLIAIGIDAYNISTDIDSGELHANEAKNAN